jgi:hypothetical protein
MDGALGQHSTYHQLYDGVQNAMTIIQLMNRFAIEAFILIAARSYGDQHLFRQSMMPFCSAFKSY